MKAKTNCDLVMCSFSLLARVTFICFEFSLVHCVEHLFCDWLLWLLWLKLYDTTENRCSPPSNQTDQINVRNFTFQVHCIVSCPDTEDPLPGVHDNYNILWFLCGGGDHAGHVTVVKVSLASPPQVVESFHVCESNILCGVYVERTCGEEKKFKGTMSGRFGFPFPTVWLGTQGGRYN